MKHKNSVCATVTMPEIELCNVCGGDLSHTPCDYQERRTKIDIVFEKIVEQVDAEVNQCPTCEELSEVDSLAIFIARYSMVVV